MERPPAKTVGFTKTGPSEGRLHRICSLIARLCGEKAVFVKSGEAKKSTPEALCSRILRTGPRSVVGEDRCLASGSLHCIAEVLKTVESLSVDRSVGGDLPAPSALQ